MFEWKKRIPFGRSEMTRHRPTRLVAAAARMAKEVNPNALVILGGAHATAVPEDSIAREEIDVLVYGEGEETILDLLGKNEVASPDCGQIGWM